MDLRHPLARGLAGCWLMNEGAGGYFGDASGNSSHATMAGTTFPAWVVGPDGPFLRIGTSGSYATVPKNACLELGTSNFSIEAKVRTTSADATNQLILKGASTTTIEGYMLVTLGSTGKMLLYISNGATRGNWATDNSISDGLWHHIVVSVTRASATGIKWYVDGQAAGTGDPTVYTEDISNAPVALYFSGSGSNAWNGDVSFVRFWRRALSAAEAAQLYRDPYAMFRRPRIELWSPAAQGSGAHAYVQTINDGVGATDIPAGTSVLQRLLAATLGLHADRTAAAAFNRSQAETIAASDTAARVSVLLRVLAQALGLSDARTASGGFNHSLSALLGLTDAGTGYNRQLDLASDLALADEMTAGTAGRVLTETLNEAVGLTDAQSGLSVLVRAVADVLGLTDAAGVLQVIRRLVSDAQGVTDGQILARTGAVAETLGLADAWSRISTHLRSQADTVGLTDSYSSAWTVLRTIANSLGLRDSVTQEGVGTVVKVIGEVLGLVDATTKLHLALRVLTETLTTTAAAQRLFAASRLVSDAEGITDGAFLGKVFEFAESIGVADAAARLIGFLRVQDDTEGVLDALLRVSAVLRELNEDMGLSEEQTQALGGLVTSAWTFLLLQGAI